MVSDLSEKTCLNAIRYKLIAIASESKFVRACYFLKINTNLQP